MRYLQISSSHFSKDCSYQKATKSFKHDLYSCKLLIGSVFILTTIAFGFSGAPVVRASPSDGQDFETTSPAAYQTWTITGQRTVTTQVKHVTANCVKIGGGLSHQGVGGSKQTSTNNAGSHSIGGDPGRTSCTYRTSYRDVTTVYYTMHLVPFTYTPHTSVDKSTVRAGDTVTFSHRITGNGTPPAAVNPPTLSTNKSRTGAQATYNYNFLDNLFRCNPNPSSCYFDSRDAVLPTYSGRTTSYDTKVTIGKDTPQGVKICYETTVSPATEQGGSTKSSDNACTTVGLASAPYNLVPSVTRSTNGPAEPGELITLSYDIQNTTPTTESAAATWSTYGVKVNPGVDTTPITSGNLREGITPQDMLNAVGGTSKGSLFDVNKLTGNRSFPPSATTNVASQPYQLPNDAAVGSKYCFVLSVAPPTANNSPSNRHSLASCITVGRKPKLNIYGGDLYVGRRFASDNTTPSTVNSVIRTSLSVYGGSTNKTFGSWTEYDAYAPGDVSGFATASGLQGGRATTTPDQSQWSKLTFVNNGSYGNFGSTSSLGTIPDTALAVARGVPLARTLANSPADARLTVPDSRASARYDKPAGDLQLDGSTIGAGTSAVVNVPNGTVTITGNLNYAPGPYTSGQQIPQLMIIAKNIVIAANVTNVDAWLIARAPAGAPAPSAPSGGAPAPAVGTIKTCDVTPPLTTSMCTQRLTVNGPVMANQLLLYRTAGLTGPTSGGGALDDQPAEVFNLRADAYLWIYYHGGGTTKATATYVTELPPRF